MTLEKIVLMEGTIVGGRTPTTISATDALINAYSTKSWPRSSRRILLNRFHILNNNGARMRERQWS